MLHVITYGLVLAAASAFSATAAAAVDDKEVAKCAAIKETLQRLACYDGLADTHNLAPKTLATTVAGKGNWGTTTKTDPLNDQPVHMALLIAESGKGRFGDEISLLVRCAKNTTDLYINWESFLGTDDVMVTHRVGKEKAVRQAWTASTDHKKSFYPGSPVGVLKKIMEADTFVVSATPYSEGTITAVFNVTGAKEALADIRKGCKW